MGALQKNVQEVCEIRLTRTGGLGSIRQLARKIGRIAQLEERCPYKAEVTGSIPVPPTTEGMWIQAVRAGITNIEDRTVRYI